MTADSSDLQSFVLDEVNGMIDSLDETATQEDMGRVLFELRDAVRDGTWRPSAEPVSIADMAPGTTDEERIRRDERMRWAIYLWGMDEDTDDPEGAFEEGADMAYHAVAAWLLANIARGFEVSDMPWLDPDLIADAKQKARLLPAHPDSEVHEVDRCIATLAELRDVAPPPATPEGGQ